jgi:hypothetical protein
VTERLKLRAMDDQDLAVVSSYLQDAVLPLTEVTYLPREHRFAFVASRFRWENCDEGDEAEGVFERINCGVVFDHVTRVRSRNIDLRDRGQTFDLLAVRGSEAGIDLIFSGDREVRLEVDRIVCHLQDIGEPWPTRWKPGHPVESDD